MKTLNETTTTTKIIDDLDYSEIIIVRVPNIACSSEIYDSGSIEWFEEDSEYVSYLALAGNQIAGILTIHKRRSIKTKYVKSLMTVIRPRWRGLGVGKKLWNEMIRREKPKKIIVRTVTNKGLTLVSSLQKSHQNIKWNIDIEPGLKILKKKGKRARA